MYTKWTAHCKTDHEKVQFEADLRRAKPVLDRLMEILNQRKEEIYREELSKDIFDIAAWPYLQASSVGSRREIQQLYKLIDLDKQKDTTND